MPVKMGLLALLLNGPAHGYELRQRFEDAAGGVWPLNIGQVYDSLKRLDRDGYVERADSVETDGGDGRGGERRAFQLTATGREEATRWLQEAVESTAVSRDELAMRVLIAYATGADLTTPKDRRGQAW
jgi:DNA-binding PadR family transcriptional regulator